MQNGFALSQTPTRLQLMYEVGLLVNRAARRLICDNAAAADGRHLQS
jgi:hypothetical protein